VLVDGSMQCWGLGTSYQLGDGVSHQSSTAVDVTTVSATVAQAAATIESTCAVTTDGTVDCWGGDDLGTLGDGVENGPHLLCAGIGEPCGDDSPDAVAVEYSNMTQVSGAGRVDAARDDFCATLYNGEVACWGVNETPFANIINDSTGQPLTGVDQVAIGSEVSFPNHVCALMTNGTVECWGSNGVGQLGDGTTTDSPTPVTVVGLNGAKTLTGAVQVVAGNGFNCALLSNGTVACWGGNFAGQLGSSPSTLSSSSSPVAVTF
jgi:alpha-tubulin suppressor-like RCC1 family protein